MCNQPNCRHDLDDDRSDLLGGAGDAAEFAKAVLAPRNVTSTVTFEEPCDKCRGTGRFVGYTGRVLGDCFTCKGTGVRRYKQTAEQRAKARAAAAAKRDAKDAEAKAVLAPRNVTSTVTFEEPCDKCRGTGRFVGYTGRVLGDCFTCKGTGVRRYKQTAEQRAKARAAAAAKRDAKDAEAKASCEAWLEANPAEAEWLREAAGRGFEFAASLWGALRKYGHFTEKQEAAVRNAAAKSAARKAQWAAEKAAREAQWAAEKAAREEGAATLSLAKIRAGFDSALQHLKRPKLRIADIQFSLAPASGRNAGCIYVVRASDDTYLGKITPEDKFLTSRDCTAADSETVARVAADPAAAATAHGHEYGYCSCCGRELTNPESVARGIGPICADRWGW